MASSAAESKLGGLFCNAQDGTILCLALNGMGHPQTKATLIYMDKVTAVSIANNSIKKQQSKGMNMHYFLVLDQVTLNNFRLVVLQWQLPAWYVPIDTSIPICTVHVGIFSSVKTYGA